MSISEYLKTIGVFNDIMDINGGIPKTVDDLYDALEDADLNYWSYGADEQDEIEDMDNVVLVQDRFGDKRYFELKETDTW